MFDHITLPTEDDPRVDTKVPDAPGMDGTEAIGVATFPHGERRTA